MAEKLPHLIVMAQKNDDSRKQCHDDNKEQSDENDVITVEDDTDDNEISVTLQQKGKSLINSESRGSGTATTTTTVAARPNSAK